MSPHDNSHGDPCDTQELLACIDTEDLEFIIPIREYLEANGCSVLVNSDSVESPQYNLVCGDKTFVRTITARAEHKKTKRFIVLIGGSIDDAKNIFKETSNKTALVGPHVFSSRQTRELFAYFFTGSEPIKVFLSQEEARAVEKSRNESVSFEEKIEEAKKISARDKTILHSRERETEDEDQKRIALSLSSIFGETPSKDSVTKIKQKKKNTLFFLPKINITVSIKKRLAILVFFLVFPFFWYGLTFFASGMSLYFSFRSLRAGNAGLTERYSASASWFASRALEAHSVLFFPFLFIGNGDMFRESERLIRLLETGAEAGLTATRFLTEGQGIAASLFTPMGGNTLTASPAEAIASTRHTIDLLSGELGMAEGELSALLISKPFPLSVPPVLKQAEKSKQLLEKTNKLLSEATALLTLYPDLAGFTGKKTYLIVFQNSMELRPTGGFIGSLATATFADGKLSEFAIQDVYTIDGQLKGHVDPPIPLQEILSQEHWYLRDSNWDPDFKKSANKIAWFYEKETGVQVDGVVAVNVPVITELLRATGPIDLADYGDRITADNFFGKSIHYTQSGFFPGSTQKKDFLGALATSILAKVTSGKGMSFQNFLPVVANGLQSGDFLFWFADTEKEAVVSQLGWAGSVLIPTTCGNGYTHACLSDQVSLVEANLSVNKVNYFINRSVSQQIVIAEDGSISETTSIVLKNTSQEEIQGIGGNYRVYSRLLVPVDAVIDSVTIDGLPVTERNPKKKFPALPYVDTPETGDIKTIPVAYDVPKGNQKRLTITYHRQIPIQFINGKSTYVFIVRKQPGMLNTIMDLQITYPIFWQLTPESLKGSLTSTISGRAEQPVGSQTFLAKQTRLEYNTVLTGNNEIQLMFVK